MEGRDCRLAGGAYGRTADGGKSGAEGGGSTPVAVVVGEKRRRGD